MLAMTKGPKTYDRRASDLPINSVTTDVIVDDPYSTIGEKELVRRSVRDDPLAAMLARHEIDQAQYDAGRLYERYAELAEIGGVAAIDPTKEPVDGGYIREPVTDAQIKAVKRLNAAGRALGIVGEAMVRDILVRRYSFRQVASVRMMTTDREVNRLRHRFVECLETLAGEFGCRS